MRRAFLTFAKVFLVAVSLMAILAAVFAWAYGLPFIGTLAVAWAIGGLATLGLAALMGSGLVEGSYYRSDLMSLSSTYMDVVVAEHPQRRRDELDYLIEGSLFGAALLGIAALAAYAPLLVFPTFLVLLIVVVVSSRSRRTDAQPEAGVR